MQHLLLSGNDSGCGLPWHIQHWKYGSWFIQHLKLTVNTVGLEFWSSQCPEGEKGRKNLNRHGRLARRSQSFLRRNFSKVMEAETEDGILAVVASLVIRWKLLPTCSKLPCNGHKSDNKVYLLLAHCIVGGEPSNKKIIVTTNLIYAKFSFHCLSLRNMWAMTKECKFVCIRSNFDRPHILFSLKILLIHHNDQTLCQR